MTDDFARKHLSVGFIRSSREGWNHGIRHRCTFRANGSKRIAEIDLFRGYVGSIRGFRSRLFDGFLVSRTQSTLLFLCEGHRLGVRYAAACGVLSMRNVACHPRPVVTWLAGSYGVFLPRSSPLHPLSLFDPPSSSCRRYSYSLSRFVGRTRTGRSLIRMREANGNSLGHPIVRRRKETTKKGSRERRGRTQPGYPLVRIIVTSCHRSFLWIALSTDRPELLFFRLQPEEGTHRGMVIEVVYAHDLITAEECTARG